MLLTVLSKQEALYIFLSRNLEHFHSISNNVLSLLAFRDGKDDGGDDHSIPKCLQCQLISPNMATFIARFM